MCSGGPLGGDSCRRSSGNNSSRQRRCCCNKVTIGRGKCLRKAVHAFRRFFIAFSLPFSDRPVATSSSSSSSKTPHITASHLSTSDIHRTASSFSSSTSHSMPSHHPPSSLPLLQLLRHQTYCLLPLLKHRSHCLLRHSPHYLLDLLLPDLTSCRFFPVRCHNLLRYHCPLYVLGQGS